MAVKKTELYSSLWASCDALRGGMDASQYKDYILSLLFMKYVIVALISMVPIVELRGAIPVAEGLGLDIFIYYPVFLHYPVCPADVCFVSYIGTFPVPVFIRGDSVGSVLSVLFYGTFD